MPKGASSIKKKASKKRSTLPDSLFATTVVKTVDTRISSVRAEEDEEQLVEMEMDKSTAGSFVGDSQTASEPERTYKAQHQSALPKEW